ncbi:MAG: Crp/Fnr family transcriptional regulator, partial [Elusimicrobia bacterium]|nr:Crp/Fnr family transcriptional regulator [Elusimicrobiota bacterium]
ALSFDGRCIRGKFERDPGLGYEFYRRFSLMMSRRLENTFLQMVGLCE